MLANWCLSLLDNFQSARELVNHNSGSPSSVFHLMDQSRDNPFVAVYVDATFKEENLEFGTRYAIYDPCKIIMAAGGQYLNPPGSVLAAELEAIKQGLNYCLENNIAGFHIFLNSHDVVHAIRSTSDFLGIEGHRSRTIIKKYISERYLVYTLLQQQSDTQVGKDCF